MNNHANGSEFTPTAESLLAQSGFGSRYRNLVPAGPSAMTVPIPPVATPTSTSSSTNAVLSMVQKKSNVSANAPGVSPEKPMKPNMAPKPPKPSTLPMTTASSVYASTERSIKNVGARQPIPPPRVSSRDDVGKVSAKTSGPPAVPETPAIAAEQSHAQKVTQLGSKSTESSLCRMSESSSMFDRIQKLSFRNAETASSATTPPPPSALPVRPLSRGAVLEELMDGEEKLADRTIIREGVLQKLSRRGYSPLLFILTDDALIYCSQVLLTNKLKHNRTISLNGILLRFILTMHLHL